MNIFRVPLIAALTMISCAAFAQQSKPGIRVITPDSEHVYSADPSTPTLLLDDEALQLQNERAQREKIRRQLERDQRENARRQEELDAESARLGAEQDQAAATAYGTTTALPIKRRVGRLVIAERRGLHVTQAGLAPRPALRAARHSR
jgi:hypothetical protein